MTEIAGYWHGWFAWRPVRLHTGAVVCWRRIERRRVAYVAIGTVDGRPRSAADAYWEYRLEHAADA